MGSAAATSTSNGTPTTAILVWRNLRSERLGYARRLAEGVVEGYQTHNLLTYANAIAFRVFFAVVPFGLMLLGIAGALNLQSVWENDLSNRISPHVSPAALSVMDSTVARILGAQHTFWITIGAAIALWQVSAAMRAVIGALNRIYGAREEGPFKERLVLSLWLAAAVSLIFIATMAEAWAVPGVLGFLPAPITFVVRWAVALALLFAAVWLIVRFAPATRQPRAWASFGALLTVFAWFVTSLAFGWYLTSVAQYSSIFGSLATVIVAMEYVYLSTLVFLTGVQADAVVRHEVDPEQTPAPGEATLAA